MHGYKRPINCTRTRRDGWSAGLGPNASYSGGSEYRFDYYAAFVFISTYIRLNNDTAFLEEHVLDHTAGPPSTSACVLRCACSYVCPGSAYTAVKCRLFTALSRNKKRAHTA